MNETQPQPPEPDTLTEQDTAPVEKLTTLEEVLTALTAVQADQRKILYILEAPLREVAAKKAQDEINAQELKDAIARGEFDYVSG